MLLLVAENVAKTSAYAFCSPLSLIKCTMLKLHDLERISNEFQEHISPDVYSRVPITRFCVCVCVKRIKSVHSMHPDGVSAVTRQPEIMP